MDFLPEAQLGWLAGIMDGEGCITITRQRPGGHRQNYSYRLYIKVAMGHLPTVQRIQELVGLGAITTCLQPGARWNQAWTWWAANRQAVEVLEAIRPYLVTKAVEADMAFEWGRLPLAPRGGKGGGQQTPPDLLAARHALFVRLQEAKPSHRFRQEK